jgi:dsRNA-specific ribonuclease
MDNPANNLVKIEDINHILNYYNNIGDNNLKLNITEEHLKTFQLAFVHESYTQWINNYLSSQNNFNKTKIENIYIDYITTESNERMEYLGDSVLKGIISRYLFERFYGEREGFMTKLKIKLEKSSMLYKFAKSLNFEKFLLLSIQVENQTILGLDRGRRNSKFFEDLFEAFIGAIMVCFGEKGYIYTERFVRNIIEANVDFSELILTNDNFKDSLQRLFQSKKFKTPLFYTLDENGPLYRKIFTRYTLITQEQMTIFDENIQQNIKNLNNILSKHYQTTNKEIYEKIYNMQLNNNYILSVGCGKKLINAEQECAENCLVILNTSTNY